MLWGRLRININGADKVEQGPIMLSKVYKRS